MTTKLKEALSAVASQIQSMSAQELISAMNECSTSDFAMTISIVHMFTDTVQSKQDDGDSCVVTIPKSDAPLTFAQHLLVSSTITKEQTLSHAEEYNNTYRKNNE